MRTDPHTYSMTMSSKFKKLLTVSEALGSCMVRKQAARRRPDRVYIAMRECAIDLGLRYAAIQVAHAAR